VLKKEMDTIRTTLDKYGKIGVHALKEDIQKISATGKTADSIRYEVNFNKGIWELGILGRKYFSAIETGRGPRTSAEYGGFDESMLEYMNARGIGSDLPEKKRKQLAKFLTYKINKEGDKTYKEGGRTIYSPTIDKLVQELKAALKEDLKQLFINEIRKQINKAA
jgi:hypothetical protein